MTRPFALGGLLLFVVLCYTNIGDLELFEENFPMVSKNYLMNSHLITLRAEENLLILLVLFCFLKERNELNCSS